MNKIRELSKESSRLLSSSQIISSVYSVVKELVENALDVKPRNIEIKLENYGLEKIEVRDNGSGIHKDDIPFVAKSHCTSKITDHSDLNRIETYGFRGEALGGICSVADLHITTKTSSDDIGTTYSFDHNGGVVSSKLCSCTQGSIVAVLKLFQNVPVRKKYYNSEKNKKEELKKIEDLLISFGCIKFNIRFVLYHNKALIWQKSMANNTKEALILTLGNSVLDYMQRFEYVDEQSDIKMEIFLPTCNAPVTCGHVSSCRCIIAINERPVRVKEIDKLLKEYYSKIAVNISRPHYPVCYISIFLPPAKVDANVEPNKTNVMVHNLDNILVPLEDILKKHYEISPCSNIVQNECTKTPQTSGVALDVENSFITTKVQNNLTKPKFQQPAPASSPGVNKVTPIKTVVRKTIHLESLETPAKKRKTSKFLSSQNDIHHHINTMKKFFSSDNNSDVVNSEKTQLSLDTECLDPKNPITVKRNSEIFESEKTICGTENTNLEATNLSTVSERKRHLSDSYLFLSQKETFKERPLSSDINKIPLWSIGLHPTEKQVQPTLVLQPKTVGPVNVEKVSNEQRLDADKVLNSASLEKRTDVNHAPNLLSTDKKLSAFEIFCRQNRLEVAAENPSSKSPQIAQILTEKWSHLSSEEKAVYKSLAMKNYPKNVKNKEKLGKTISQNLIKMKNGSVTKKPEKKHTKKLKEKTVYFELEAIKNAFPKSGSQNLKDEGLNIINCLAPGIWICSKNNEISLLNSFRLQETIIYYRLLNTYRFETESVVPPQLIPLSSLGGDDILETIFQLNGGSSNYNEYVQDERLIANGFKVALRQDENHAIIEIFGITKDISFYGLPDLREILTLIMEKGHSAKLSECRPGKVNLYLQGEAVRIARQSHPSQRVEDIIGILDQRRQLPLDCERCIHCKPFFNELWQKNTDQSFPL